MGGVAVLPPSGKSGKNKENENVNGEFWSHSVQAILALAGAIMMDTFCIFSFAGIDKDTSIKSDKSDKSDKSPTGKRKVNMHF